MPRKSLLSAAAGAALLTAALLSGCANDSSSNSQSGTEQSAQSAETTESSDIQPDSAQPPVDRDYAGELPEITLPTKTDAPEMTPVAADAPQEITVKTLAEGKGKKKVGPDDYIRVNYAGWLWDGEKFDSSFSSSGQAVPISFSLNQVIQGWKWGLTDTRVGDQVMVVIPPQYGYGTQDTASIPGGSTLVFYVEILDRVSVSADVLEDAKVTDAAVPTGILIEGEPGVAPLVSFDQSAEMPTEQQAVVLFEGSGPVVSDEDAVQYLMTVGYWGSQERSQTWEDGVQMVDAGSILAGEKVGSRILLITPAQDEANPASYAVVDILAAHPVR